MRIKLNNSYRFYVDALTSDAETKLNRVKKLMDEIDQISSKGANNGYRATPKDMEASINMMRELARLTKEVNKAMEDSQRAQAQVGNNEGASILIQDQKKLQEELDRTKIKFNQSTDHRAGMSSLNRDILKDMKLYNDELTESEQRLRKINEATKEYTRMASRGDARAHAASSSGSITNQQATRFQKDYNTAKENSPEIARQNQARRDQLRKEQEKDQQELRNVRKNFNGSPQERQMYESQLQDNIKMRYKEIEALKKFDDTVQSTVDRLERANSTMASGGVRQQADPSSIEGIMNSRAPSISMAVLGSVMAVVGSMYSRGGTANEAMRNPTISIGQRTGNYDFRSIRKANQEMGLESGLGYKGGDMLAFQDTVLSNMGYTNDEDLSASTRQMAEGARAIPVDQTELSNTLGELMKVGAISGKDQIRGIEEGFLGAIQKSGMAGREKDQLQALQTLTSQMFSGRNGSNEELKNTMAIQTLISSGGDRSMQGTAGAEALSSIDAGIRGGVDNKNLRLMYGGGTKYQSLGGKFQQRRDMAKGISDPDLIKTMFDSAKTFGGASGLDGEKEAFIQIANSEMGANLSADQVDALYKASNNGQDFNNDKIKQIMKDMEEDGSSKYDKNAEGYKDSKEATADRAEAVAEKQASYLNDLGDAVRKVKSELGGLSSPIYALGAAAIAASVAMATSAAMSVGSSVIKGATSSLFGAGAGAAGASAGGAGLGSLGAGAAGVGGGLWAGTKALGGKALGVGAKAGGKLASMAPALAKVAPWMSVGTAALDGFGGAKRSDAWLGEDGSKASGKVNSFVGGVLGGTGDGLGGKESGGSKALGIAGGTLKGAGIGALIGSVVPVVGTAIGAVVGGAIGGIGSAIGGSNIAKGMQGAWNGVKSAGSWLVNGSTAHADELTDEERAQLGSVGGSKENQAKKKEQDAKSSEKVQAEKIRQANNATESNNLSLFNTILSRAERLLAQARSQNGIFGSANGSGSGSGTGSGTGELKTIGDGKKWTNTDITKHDLGSTMEGLTADQLNEWIDSVAPEGSSMRGLGETFMEAGRQSGLDPRYLVGHAALETGWGGGYSNGDPNKGNWFGIGAFDSNPDNANNYGDGIIGGAKWIAENYYNQGQTTLDSMRNNGGEHQYATDPEWDKKIASIMGGSDKYTKATQTFKTEANINVYTSGGENSKDARNIGKEIGVAAKQSWNEQYEFFTQDMRRA